MPSGGSVREFDRHSDSEAYTRHTRLISVNRYFIIDHPQIGSAITNPVVRKPRALCRTLASGLTRMSVNRGFEMPICDDRCPRVLCLSCVADDTCRVASSAPRTPQSGETPPSMAAALPCSIAAHTLLCSASGRNVHHRSRAAHHYTRHPQHPLRRVQHERQTRHARHKSATRVHASAARSMYPTGCEALGHHWPKHWRFTSLQKGSPPA